MQRGRKSISSLLVKPISKLEERPQPPDRLSKQEAIIWDTICECMPINWFTPETQSVLEALCVQIVFSREMDQELRAFPRKMLKIADGSKALKHIHQMQVAAQKMVIQLATKLRLTPQSRYNAITANTLTRNATEERAQQPWDISRQREDA